MEITTDFVCVWCCANKVAARSQSLGNIFEHYVGLFNTFKAIVKSKLAAYNVKRNIFILVYGF